MRIRVGPAGKVGAPLLIIGESPGETEVEEGKPFVGHSGRKLMEVLNANGLQYDDVYMMNLSMYRPPNNKFEASLPSDIAEGVEAIENYIIEHRPNCILALGESPLRYLTGRESISNHRGSILPCVFDHATKVCCANHPSFILRNPSQYSLFFFDVKRAVEQSAFRNFPYVSRDYVVVDNTNIDLAFRELSGRKVAVDIETTKKDKSIICVGFASGPEIAYSIQFNQYTYPYIKLLLEDAKTGKIFHYGYGFDIEVLYLNGINVAGMIDDTYILSHAHDPRLPRDLGFLTSIHTYEPYYKTSGRATLPSDSKAWGEKLDRKELYIYNAKDCAVTYEIYLKILSEIDMMDAATYLFEMEDAKLAQKISRTGLPFSEENRSILRDAVLLKWKKAQLVLNSIVGRPINVNSNKQIPSLLYDTFELPVKKNKAGNRTGDDDALVEHIGFLSARADAVSKQSTKGKYLIQLGCIQLIRNIRGYRKLLSSYVEVVTDENRVKSMYNAAGTDFGRWSCNMYVNETGANNQTWPRGKFDLPDINDNLDEFKRQIAEEFKDEPTE